MDAKSNIAVVGGSGVVGKELLGALAEAGHPAEKITVLGSERSEGQELEYSEDTLEVEKAEAESFRGMNVVFLATPADVSRKWAAAAQGAGAWVIDLSSAHRLDPNVPLFHAVRGPPRLPARGRVLAVASPLTSLVARLLETLQAQGVSELSLTAMMGASGRGMAGVRELEKQTAGLLSGRDVEPEAFPHRLGFNLIPEVGALSDQGVSEAEAAVPAELARLIEGELPLLSTTALWVPTFYGTYVSATLRLRAGGTLESMRSAFKKEGTGVKLLDSPAEHVYPLPQLVVGDPDLHVGRLRLASSTPGVLSLVAALDNTGYAARTALELARSLT